jgi:polar amino acid transport system substrate-binding protein
MGDPASGTFQGYEADLLEHVADRLECTLEYHRALWSVITEELVWGRLDLVCSAATVTEQRKNKVSFSNPYLQLKLASVVR